MKPLAQMRSLCGDWKSAEELVHELKPGDLIEFERGTYNHWGVYVGFNFNLGSHVVIHKLQPESTTKLFSFLSCTITSGLSGSVKGKVTMDTLQTAAEGSKCRVNNSFDEECEPLPVEEVLKRATTSTMSENEISDSELEPNPCEMETPEDDKVEETFRKRNFDYENEKLRADVRFNCILGILDSERTKSTDWCSCTNCKVKEQPRECACCLEYKSADDTYADKVRSTWEDGIACMSEALFVGVATNQESLDFAILNMSNKKREKLARSRDKNKTRRYLAYKRCVYHLFGKMTHGERIILPSCVVNKILKKFPPTNDEKRKGFRRGHEIV